MMQRLLFSVCVLLVVASLDAKKLHKKSSFVLPPHDPAACEDGRVKCPNSDRCIPQRWFCDGDNDCGDASDESDCPPVTCLSGQTKCPTTNLCRSTIAFCDGVNDCGDNSDEPEVCRSRTCPEGQLKCNSGQCVDLRVYCTANDRCRDDTQFVDGICPDVTCDPGTVKCPRNSRCIKSSFVCDGDNDCGDSTDEPADCSERSCVSGEFKCGNGQCLNQTSLCLSMDSYGCRDSTDTANLCSDFMCPTGYFKCVSDGKCTVNSNLCDGSRDCSDGSDESPEHCANQESAEMDSNFNPDSSSDPAMPSLEEMNCMMALRERKETCTNILLEEMSALDKRGQLNKLLEIDLSELCGAAQELLACFRSTLSPCANVDNPSLNYVKQMMSVGESVLNYVCVQRVEVFNRSKACLLRVEDPDDNSPDFTLLKTFIEACARHFPPADRYRPTPRNKLDKFCMISDEAHVCAKDVVTAQCGDEVADAMRGLVDVVVATVGCTNLQPLRSLRYPQKLNRGFPFNKKA